jgi:HSP20 family protein
VYLCIIAAAAKLKRLYQLTIGDLMARPKNSMSDLLGITRNMNWMLSGMLLQEHGQRPVYWHPPTDVYETTQSVVILIEIAGMDPDKIQVEFGDKILRVSGRRADRHTRAACHCLEVQYGEFSTEVYLPGQYDTDAIDAEYKDGFLTITLPKVMAQTLLLGPDGTQD